MERFNFTFIFTQDMDFKRIAITIDVEEWFSSSWFNVEYLFKKYYNNSKPNTDIIKPIKNLLTFFKIKNIKATFFILGKTIQRYPEISDILRSGIHEIASHGFYHRDFKDKKLFYRNIKKGKKLLENQFPNKNIHGFRMPDVKINNWKLHVIGLTGFKYDSSIAPCLKIPGWYGNPTAPTSPFSFVHRKYVLKEYPLAVFPYIRLPANGGWFLRHFNYQYFVIAIKTLLRTQDSAVLYFHPWEFSEHNPKHKEIPKHVFHNCGYKNFDILGRFVDSLNEKASFVTLSEIPVE